MSVYDFLLSAGAGAGAVSAIIALIIILSKPFKKRKAFFDNITKSIEDNKKEIADQKAIIAEQKELIDDLTNTTGEMAEKLKLVESKCHTAYMLALMLSVKCKEMALEARLRSGELYEDEGGNGEIKVLFRTLQKQYASILMAQSRKAQVNRKDKK